MQRAERCLEAGHAERRLLERDVLLVARVWGVIRRDAVDGAVEQALDEGATVVLGAERRVHLGVRVERADELVGRTEMMRAGLRAHAHPRLARAADGVDRRPRGQVLQVHRPALVGGEREVALDHQALGDGRPAREAELRRHGALVHLAAAGQGRLLAMERQRTVGDRAVGERPAHECRRRDRPPVVGERDRTGGSELRHLGQLLPALPLRDRRREARRDDRLLVRLLDERLQDGGGVDDRVGVRHRDDRAVASGRCRMRSRRDRLLVLAPRGAQVDVRVDERRREDEPFRSSRDALDRGDDAVLDGHGGRAVEPLDGIDHARADRQRVPRSVRPREHHATSMTGWATWSPGAVSRS